MKRRLKLLVAAALPALVGAGLGTPAFAQVPADKLEVMLAIDMSGSMRHAIDAAKSAANEFVAAMPADVRIGVETFGDTASLLTPPTTDRALVSREINGIATHGDTALYDAVVDASGRFTPAAEQKVLVVLSDGRDDGSAATLDQAIAAVRGEQVEAISLTTDETDLASLQALGRVTAAEDSAAVSAAFARVAALVVETMAPAEPSAPATTPPPAPTTAPPPTATPTTSPPVTTSAPATTVYSRPPAPAAAGPSRSHRSSSPLWLGSLGIFAGLFVLGMLLFPRQRVSKARLGIKQPRLASDLGKRTMSAVEEALERHGKRAGLATALAVADIAVPPGQFVAAVALIAVVAGLVGLLIGGPLLALPVALFVGLIAKFYVTRKKRKRQLAFADQLPEVLQLVTTALRSGYGIAQALESVAEEAEEPARGEFAHLLVETRLGRDLSDAMHALAERMESTDLEWVVSAIDINRDTGGNLSEVLGTVSGTIRERQRMARQVNTLTAEGRLSARILWVMPFGMVLLQWRTNPENIALLTHGAGLAAVVFGGVLMVLGALWVRRIVNSIAL